MQIFTRRPEASVTFIESTRSSQPGEPLRTEPFRRRQGFTLIEMMIAVAIIGLLASVAIPSFRNYQWKAKRSEAYTNLGALAGNERSYMALNDAFSGVANAEPGASSAVPNDIPSENSRPSGAVGIAFGALGWAPEGQVYYDYDANVDGLAGGSCSCQKCFTLTAYGNVDGDATGGAVMYVHRGTQGLECKSIMFPMGAPLDPVTGRVIYDAPAPNTAWDDY
jgi:prepilin-type N-terminal cleavage/methylation domain-containing protein